MVENDIDDAQHAKLVFHIVHDASNLLKLVLLAADFALFRLPMEEVVRKFCLVCDRVVGETLTVFLDRCEMHCVVVLLLEAGEDFGPALDGSQAPRNDRADAQLLALESR